nr:MAG TPA: hypothetical protein [Caudoviricetes sp.]
MSAKRRTPDSRKMRQKARPENVPGNQHRSKYN